MHKHTLESEILRQLAYYPAFRGLARVVLKAAVFEGKCGKVSHAELFEYITTREADAVQIMNHFHSSEVITMLTEEGKFPSFTIICPALFFSLLEMYVKGKLLEIVGGFHDDHFREECFIFLNSDVDFFEMIDTLQKFLAHYKHPGLAAVEEIALILDEKVLKIKQNHRAFQLLQQAATLLELHHPKTTIDTLFQPIYDLC